MVQATIQTAQTELQRAQVAIGHWNAMGEMRVKQIGTALQEANAYSTEIQSILQTMQGYTNTGMAYIQEATGYISQANGYMQEVQTRMARDNQLYSWFNARYNELKVDYDTAFTIMAQGGRRNEG